uniref:S-layer homology domain-containing protein n=1 Tax=Lactococcus petauri TaxID=1940789 RepID=UPI001F577956
TYTYNGQVVEAHLTVAPAFYTVTFKADANGALQGQTSVRVAKDGKIITLPTPKPHKYYTFDGWYDKNNKKVDPKKVSIKDNTTFTAKFNRLIILKPLPVKHNASPFKDISKSIFKNHINFIYSRGITTGYTPTTYNPEGKVTRGEMAVFLYRLAGSPHYTPTSNPFKDITLYKNQILWMDYTTVTQGTRPYYNPNGNVTRGQMAAFLHRMAVIAGKTPENKKYVPPFTDAKKHMFANDIGWAKAQGITTGYTPTIFKPDASITRGEMAAFLQRFYNQFNK